MVRDLDILQGLERREGALIESGDDRYLIVSSMVIVSSAVWAEKNLLLRRVFDAPREGSAPLLRYISSITQRAAGAGAT